MVSTTAMGTHETSAEGDRQANDATYNMRFVQERLLEAFKGLDEAMASRLIAPMSAIYPIEQVCTELITPTL